ncbi:zinc-binding dehydrogenase [Vibrio sp. PP-XX7]
MWCRGNSCDYGRENRGANPIIAVDLHDDRLELARASGATHTFNAKEDTPAKIRELCPQGLGYALDTTGIKTVVQDLYSLLAPKGILGIVGVAPRIQCWHLMKMNLSAAGGQ